MEDRKKLRAALLQSTRLPRALTVILIAASLFFGVFFVYNLSCKPMSMDELTVYEGRFADLDKVRTSRYSSVYVLLFEDGTRISMTSVHGFDKAAFLAQAGPGDWLQVYAKPDLGNAYAILKDGETIHSYETTAEGLQENRRAGMIVTGILTLMPILLLIAGRILSQAEARKRLRAMEEAEKIWEMRRREQDEKKAKRRSMK